METIRLLNLRLDQVTIEHLDWKYCLKLYDRPATFFFLDPPYTKCGATNYDAWKDSDVLDLRRHLDGLRGRWLLTLNDSPSIRSIFHDCQITPISRARGIANKSGGKTPLYKELIIAPR
jgi:DNA adenine methylase